MADRGKDGKFVKENNAASVNKGKEHERTQFLKIFKQAIKDNKVKDVVEYRRKIWAAWDTIFESGDVDKIMWLSVKIAPFVFPRKVEHSTDGETQKILRIFASEKDIVSSKPIKTK